MTASKGFEGLSLTKDKKIPVILDIGTAYTNCPRHIIPTEVRRYHSNKITRIFTCDQYSTDELYDVLIDFFKHIYFKLLLVNPRDRRVVVVESLFSPIQFRKTLAKALFQHYNVPSIMFLPSHLSALLSLGIATGLVIDCGYEETSLLPIVEGIPVMKCWQSLDCGGRALQTELSCLLKEYAAVTDGETSKPLPASKVCLSDEILEDIIARICFVGKKLTSEQELHIADDVRQQMSTTSTQSVPIPPSVSYPLDGCTTLIIPGIVREKTADLIFKHDKESKSLPTTILDVILKCPLDVRRSLMENIVVVGGTAMLPGFHDRLMRELKDIATRGRYAQSLVSRVFKFHATHVPANCACWMGGSLHGSVDVLSDHSVSREHFLKTKPNHLPDWMSCDPSARTVSTAERSANVVSSLRRLSTPSSTPKLRGRSRSLVSLTPKTGESKSVSQVPTISEAPMSPE
ncbi:actin-related protein 10-like isoform X2 [Corticium candelabrum]|uniref:actin-related protein 10-like isoform X2 n=1 Tax=Corticium candelabrum TaxID=121492 RepID=UPI002E2697F1|nr:actin-related protein 10-like isoform X2 [Corticium candelabrum]